MQRQQAKRDKNAKRSHFRNFFSSLFSLFMLIFCSRCDCCVFIVVAVVVVGIMVSVFYVPDYSGKHLSFNWSIVLCSNEILSSWLWYLCSCNVYFVYEIVVENTSLNHLYSRDNSTIPISVTNTAASTLYYNTFLPFFFTLTFFHYFHVFFGSLLLCVLNWKVDFSL